MAPEEYAQLVGALKALGGVGGAALVLGVLWKQFLSEAAANKKKVATQLEARVSHLEKRLDGLSKAHGPDINNLRERVAVLEDRSDRAPQLGPEGPTVMNYPSPYKKKVTKSLPAVHSEPEHEPLEEEEKT